MRKTLFRRSIENIKANIYKSVSPIGILVKEYPSSSSVSFSGRIGDSISDTIVISLTDYGMQDY